jgi:pilus assembly protein CpaE
MRLTPPAPGNIPSDGPSHAERSPLPNIRVATFFLTERFSETVKAAVRDRRMNRVASDLEPGGIDAALAAFARRTTPNIIVVEIGSNDLDEEKSKLDALAEVCDAETRVIVAGATNDVDFYRWLTEQGVSDYVLLPAPPSAFIESLYRALRVGGAGRVIAVLPVKGGVGASVLCHHFAAAAARKSAIPTLLVDFDLPFGTAALNFDLTPLKGTAEFLFSAAGGAEGAVDKYVLKGETDLAVMGTVGSLVRILNLRPDTVVEGLRRMRKSYSTVFIDLPHAWTDWTRAILLDADMIIAVAAPDIASLRNTKSLYETLVAARPNDDPPKLVLNMVGLRGRHEVRPRDFEAASGKEADLVIPFAPTSFSDAAAQGRMLFETAPRNTETKRIMDFTSTLLTGAPESSGNLLGGLITRFFPQKS